MRAKNFIGLVLLLFGLTFLVVGGVWAAKKTRHRPPLLLPVDGARPPEAYTGPSPVMYEGGKQPDCEDIHPTIGYDYVIQHDQFGSTYYDKQKNGSMGRMIAVGPGGHRHMIFHETRGPYSPAYPRYITYNCKYPLDEWCGGDVGVWVDGGPGINAGYAQMLLLHDGTEVILYHKGAGLLPWHSSLAKGEVGYPCQCDIPYLYDIPDYHDNAVSGELHGYWPKGCVVYDAETDSNYIHIVTTENEPSAGGDQTIAYQRCVFESTDLVCWAPGGYGPYRRSPGVAGDSNDEIAVFDSIKCLSAIAVSSPVSQRVAIVYTKNRADNQVNNDVVYIESDSNGNDWLSGTQWPPTIHNITDYPTDAMERAYTDVAACYDYNDSLHIIWNAAWFDSVAGVTSYDANLYHWSKENGITLIAGGYWDDGTVWPNPWDRILAKMSISALDPVYDPGGEPDSVYLFCTWTQYDTADNAASSCTNGDICAAVSNDGGITWSARVNLTNTKTPGCDPDTGYPCLSESWSSLAENLHDGDLHIQYVCDRDAGAVISAIGTWTENPMMYLHIEQFPVILTPEIRTGLVNPASWTHPPIKVSPDSSRTIGMQVKNMGNLTLNYEVFTYNPYVVVVSGGSGTLYPGDSAYVELMIDCPGECFITDTVVVASDDTTNPHIVHRLHAVCSDDYYECDWDPRTYIEKDNCKLKLWACANTEQSVWDKRIEPEENQQVIFSSGVIVATTADNDTVVGRQDYSDVLTGARDTINIVQGYDYYEPECNIQKIHVKNTYIWTPHLPPPNDFKWWWIDIHKQIILFHDRPGYPPCPEWKKEQVIKYVWIDWSAPPVWWPDPGIYQGHEDIYVGMFADVDAPWDDGCYWACNTAGYDYAREMIWHHGWYNGLPEGHPEYEDHYVGLALTNPAGARVEPYGCQNVLNADYLWPQESWGWLNGELYQLAATPGVNIHYPDSVADRAVVLTAGMIPAGDDPDSLDFEFILIEAFIQGDPGTGLQQLQAHIDDTREILIPELNALETIFSRDFPICGDCNVDNIVNVGDLVFLATYLFQNGPPPSWPMNRADVNNDGAVNVGDLVFLATYLFQNGPPPDCSGFGRE